MRVIVKKIKELQKRLSYHEYLYHTLDSPIISDAEYDHLKRKLNFLEKKYFSFIPINAISHAVGSELSLQFNKFSHLVPMLSLENIFNPLKISHFLTKINRYLNCKIPISLCCELKIDGLALNLIYKHGILIRALTRGNGFIGEDVTINAFHINDIPLVLKGKNIPDLLEIRGEVFMLRSDFNKLNSTITNNCIKNFSNPRNIAAGSLRQTNFQVIVNRRLKFVCHGAGFIQGSNQFDSHYSRFKIFQKWGIPVFKNVFLCRNFKDILYFFNKIALERDFFDFDIDGIVIKIDSIKYQEQLGNTSKFPRWAIALKFISEEKQTKLIDVHFQVGRTGVITPVAELKPIKISGVTIRKVSLHNKFEIKRLNISIGDTVVVRRSGDVIPYIVRVVHSLKVNIKQKQLKIVFPKKCPLCSSLIVNELGSKRLRCTGGILCIAQIQKTILHFFSSSAFNITGIGKNLVYNLIKEGYIKNIVDFYKIDVHKLAQVVNMGYQSATNILNLLHTSKKIKLSQFVYALGIRDVGITIANNVSEKFNSLNKLMEASIDELKLVKKVGNVIAYNIFNFMRDKLHLNLINDLINIAGIIILPNNPPKINRRHVFFNKKIVITGRFKHFSRIDLEQRIINLGAVVSKSISKNTDFLLVGDKPGNNLFKALKLKKEVVKEKQLFDIIKYKDD